MLQVGLKLSIRLWKGFNGAVCVFVCVTLCVCERERVHVTMYFNWLYTIIGNLSHGMPRLQTM